MQVAFLILLTVSANAIKAPVTVQEDPSPLGEQVHDSVHSKQVNGEGILKSEPILNDFDDLWISTARERADSIHQGKESSKTSQRSESVPLALLWTAFPAFVAAGVLLEVFVLKTYEKDMSLTDSAKVLLFWMAVTGAFSTFLYAMAGMGEVWIFLDGYVLEIMMSCDNLFLFIMLFTSFHAPALARSKLLMIGVVGAIIARLGMFTAIEFLMGAAGIIVKILGIFIIYTAYKTVMFDDDDEEDFENNVVVKTLKKCMPLTGEIDATGSLFIDGKGTPMLLCAATLIFLDCLFAIDSVSAKSVMFHDLYLNITSTGIALFSLRAMYYMLQAMADMFGYLKYGIGLILLIIGLKVIFPSLVTISDGQYLCCIVVILAICVGISMAFPPPAEDDDAESAKSSKAEESQKLTE